MADSGSKALTPRGAKPHSAVHAAATVLNKRLCDYIVRLTEELLLLLLLCVCVCLWCAGAWDYQVGGPPGADRAHYSLVPPCAALTVALQASTCMRDSLQAERHVHAAL